MLAGCVGGGGREGRKGEQRQRSGGVGDAGGDVETDKGVMQRSMKWKK